MKKHNKVVEQRDGRTQIHNVRFYNLTPRSIQAMAYNHLWQKLALSRNDGSIEVWDVRHAPCLERSIPRSPGNSVEGIAWSGERLFSAGLNGQLVEWDLLTAQPRYKQHVTGNAIWCLDISRAGTDLAIGTEEGYINMFDITAEQLVYKNLFDKQEGRVLCCRFDASGEFLVTGSVGAIRIWNTRTGHALHKMNVTSRSNQQSETIVWSVQVLSDFTIISGDSRGHVTVWDGRTASQVETHQVLKADVLAVAVNEEEDKLLCAGIEPTIRIYAKTQIKRDDMVFYRWVKFLQRRVHDHDVKALVCARDNIYSGGVDGYLGISSATKTRSTINKYGPFLQQPCVAVAPARRLLLLRYRNYLEIWRLGSTTGSPELAVMEKQDAEEQQSDLSKSKLLSLDTVPEKLLEFKSKHEEPIVCATLSPDGRWLCYSTLQEIRLFRLTPGTSTGKQSAVAQLNRVKDLPEQFLPALHIHFTTDSRRLFLVSNDSRQIHVFAVLWSDDDGNAGTSPPLDFVECIDTSKHIKDTIKLFAVSRCGSYVVAATTDRTIAVWSVFKGKHFRHLLNLPHYSAATTAVAIHAELPRLVAAFADGKIFEYDLDEMCFTCSDHDRFLENSEHHCIANIVLDRRNPDIFVLHNDAAMFVLEKCEEHSKMDEALAENSRRKSLKKVKTVAAENGKVSVLRLKMQKPFQHLIHLCWLSSTELLAVGVNPISLIEQLPPAFKEKLFGAM